MSEKKNKPVLDEQTLAKLLEAAYVLQEHNRELQEMELGFELKRDQLEAEEKAQSNSTPAEKSSSGDYTVTLAQIVETQHQIQLRNLDLDHALALVAERAVEISRASGAAIGILDGKLIHYRAVSGQRIPKPGSTVPMDKALCVPCLRTSQAFRCADVNPEFLLDTEECRRRGIASLIAVPIFHDGGVAGGLELYYAAQNAFTDQDVHTCQLMAGLITEALAREEELTWKKSLATERAAMLEALEQLQPNLAALVGKTAKIDADPNAAKPAAPAGASDCRKCGHKLVAGEQFCGQCGSPRSTDYEPPSMQSKVASLWQMQQAKKIEPGPASSPTEAHESEKKAEDTTPFHFEASPATIAPDSVFEFEPDAGPSVDNSSPMAISAAEPHEKNDALETSAEKKQESQASAVDEDENEDTAALVPAHPADWSSAIHARDFLEQIALAKDASGVRRFWNARRGDIYLGIAVILVACVIRWGIWSDHGANSPTVPATTTSAAASHPKSPDADLSLFDRLLIKFGLADPPEAPVDRGNPNIQVWVDLHTALYYCPGADLYGKTPKGKFTNQRDAQLDQFEPAYRKVCN
ncbi:MAG TPA: GAF domain-containing protein [Candidatus Sulfotelmatobacter sp.]|nr:GAF domain-containing protein [Candidatus Sulfotelmatobacter sp.]